MDQNWGRLGEAAAEALRQDGTVSGRHTARELRAALDRVSTAQDRIGARCADAVHLPKAAEWLLDNWYLVQREGREAADCLRSAKDLRSVRREGENKPLVMELTRVLVAGDGAISVPALECFLAATQQVRPLTERELSLFVPCLKGALLERLDQLCIQLEAALELPEEEALSQGMERVFNGLRVLTAAHLSQLLERQSRVECALRQDPAGIYDKMDDETRASYRRELCRLARKKGISEDIACARLIELCAKGTGLERHVGFYLFRKPLGDPPHVKTGSVYIASVVLTTLFTVLLLGFLLHSGIVTLLLLLPVSDIVKNVLDFLLVRLTPPRPVHRLSLRAGIPKQGRTLCVIAGLLTGESSGDDYVALLERYRLANRDAGPELLFGLLADLPDRAQPMGSEARRCVDRAAQAVEALNQKYDGGFCLLFREPVFQITDERYQGWERKRGALLELTRLLKNRRSGVKVVAGDRESLRGVRFVITLDSDTSLNVGVARELVGAMLHPLNRAQVDHRQKIVTSGYGLLQPRVGVELTAANKSQFSRIFAGQGGVDPYGSTTSDVYHDLFDSGTYTGKGIFDVNAFYTCMEGRFPENTILSHDLLEGSYLHAGLIGDVELTDSYPYKVNSYFARLHRWVRGDWQLLPWLGKWVLNQAGERESNPIPAISKWKIADNLRRSLSPVCTLLALVSGMCLVGPDFGVTAGIAVLAAASNLLLSGAELAFRLGKGLRARYHSTIIAGFGGVILQTLVQLLFLPIHAWTCASAICTALWRSLVTHRGRLAWVTAADAEQKTGDGVWFNYRRQWPAVLVGVVCMMFSRFPGGGAAGLVWVLSPVFAWALSRPLAETRTVPANQRAFLLHEGALIWRFFADFLRPEDHWLPPDNWQEQPAIGLARRTSPTNIGLALLCCLAAADLDFISRTRATELISHQLDTLEGLPKWNGHLYNWYDTATAQPLHPHYVSTVDGGNLCGCLIALREGLYEWGSDELARRAEALSDGMNFSLLYDKDRKLFTIGYDAEREQHTQGWYDLMASEARQTSYIAVARGEVDPRHWRRLGRMLVGDNDYSGAASWTGTMFEYFMPNLILPLEANSFMYESLCFALYEQRRRTSKHGIPWGISESGFYAFDGALNYQYKAHGVQHLGLKRGLDTELVISPYSSFLALLLAPASAGRNLRALRDLGVEGKYGLYEALDYTPAHLTGDRPFEMVRSYMAHHLGMSLLSIDNALKDNVMQRRFMRDCSMGAYRELLQEKVPVGGAVMKSPQRDVPEKPRRVTSANFVRAGVWTGKGRPDCHLVSNGAYTVFCTATGESHSRMGQTTLTTEVGIRFYLSTTKGLTPLLPGHWRFDSGAVWETVLDELNATHTLQVPERENGEVREICLRWQGETPLQGELVCYLEPVLARQADYDAHPAFSKLFLESAYTGDGILFTRRTRGGKEGTPSMAVLWDAEQAFFDTSRERALGRGGLQAMEQALRGPAYGSVGAVLDPCVLVRIPVSLDKGEAGRYRFAVAASDGEENALSGAIRLLRGGITRENSQMQRLISACNLTSEQALQSYELLKNMVYPGVPENLDKKSLWPYGISGDYPIVVAEIPDCETSENSLHWFGSHRLLNVSGYSFDLVFLLQEGGDYHRPVRTMLIEGLKALGWEHMLGTRGGVHLIEHSRTVRKAAAVVLGEDAPVFYFPGINVNGNNFTLKKGVPNWTHGSDGSITIHTGPCLPPLGWSMMLTNGSMGWMPDETGCGHLWQGNARETPLTPWKNDPLAIGGPEQFRLLVGEKEISIFADADGLPCAVTYGPGFARWEKRWGDKMVKTTAFVSQERDARIILVECSDNRFQLLHKKNCNVKTLYTIKGEVAIATTSEGTALIEKTVAYKELNRTVMHWNRQVSSLKICTPDEAMNHYLNGWALYQIIACRLMGRTSRYQNGGAYGFRDQLQDAAATIMISGDLARMQILRACAHQFVEGDVQHWWHEPENKGVRTRISDDLLWLPYVLCEYVEKRGDNNILQEKVSYLSAPLLNDDELERYEQPVVAEEQDTVLNHAIRAVNCVIRRGTGDHGLLLMGTGDWNDGMNRVGEQGRGESEWLTWFAAHVLKRFAALCECRGMKREAEEYCTWSQRLVQAANAAWDGGWFLRGYYDDGMPLGGAGSKACQIDSIAQSWAALAPGVDRERAVTAVKAALEQLFDREQGVVKLFTPAFDQDGRDPGYIRGYVPGVRENGGQYTHAALWLALACFRLELYQEGADILSALLPEHHPAEIYKAEPYVLAADVYTNPAHLGRGGWSWYTGAAGWYYRVAMEELLGFQLRAGRLFLEPKLPSDWPGFSAVWRTERALLRIEVQRGNKTEIRLDGDVIQNGISPEALEGECRMEVTIL